MARPVPVRLAAGVVYLHPLAPDQVRAIRDAAGGCIVTACLELVSLAARAGKEPDAPRPFTSVEAVMDLTMAEVTALIEGVTDGIDGWGREAVN